MTPLFPGLIAIARAVVYCCSAFWLFGFVETQQIIGFQLVPFLAAAILCYLILRAFLSRPRPLPAVAALGVSLGGISAAVLIWRFSTFSGPLSLCLGIVFLGAVVIRAVQICTHPITAAQSISALERCTGFFIVFLWFQEAIGLPTGYSLPLMAASLLSLVTVLYQRLAAGSEADGSRKWLRGLIAVTALLLLITAALLLFYLYGSGPLTQAVLAVFAGIKFALTHLWKWLLLHRIPALRNCRKPCPPSRRRSRRKQSSPIRRFTSLLPLSVSVFFWQQPFGFCSGFAISASAEPHPRQKKAAPPAAGFPCCNGFAVSGTALQTTSA